MLDIGLLIYPEFQVLGLSMCSAFELANIVMGDKIYNISLLSERGGLVKTSVGFCVDTISLDHRLFDTLIVMGDNSATPMTPGLVAYIRESNSVTRRIGAICTGAYVLAEAGLLDGRRATTHWFRAREFQRSYPKVKVEEDCIFINDGKMWTSAGMSACIDLALALVEADLGGDVARQVAKRMVLYHRRAGGQSQFSVMLSLQPRTDRIQDVLTYAKQNLQSDLSVNELANAANLSPRQFSRVFQDETGQSPAKAIENLRVESARLMIEAGHYSIDRVAADTGFGGRERMRRAFLRAFGQPPQIIQRAERG
ncbi:AraC family transcriptional regulator [Pseudomonas sp. RIT-PI-q]|uniref:GlxA family transcriptional regulator n=1 Tax=Pseudomonas sp. RIT-PI-q TaxID=1690247 RepID=UPI0006CDE8B9|nr:GlxA family transcriptional regulator [Pseudomonas sp. RIT-PI-q]KPG95997.1 AraC family transcriptional regulator [Pseudomonas sp. RIT-PI-q]